MLPTRSGIVDANWLLNQIREQFQEVQNSKNQTSITLADCSRNAWENGGFGVGDLDFYSKGFMVGAILDASIWDKPMEREVTRRRDAAPLRQIPASQPGLPEKDGILET